jgi:hypothetical protein
MAAVTSTAPKASESGLPARAASGPIVCRASSAAAALTGTLMTKIIRHPARSVSS